MSFTAPEPLGSAHDVAAFDCGIDELNTWLRRRALTSQDEGSARTFVVTAGSRVVGYYAIAAGSVSREQATGRTRRNMPEPIPMALLARLAVDRSAQGFGVGAGLLQDAILRITQAAAVLGIRGILVDAVNDEAKAFYEKFGFRPSSVLPFRLMITLQEVERVLQRPE